MTVINTRDEASTLVPGTILRLPDGEAALVDKPQWWRITGQYGLWQVASDFFPAIVVWTPGSEDA